MKIGDLHKKKTTHNFLINVPETDFIKDKSYRDIFS